MKRPIIIFVSIVVFSLLFSNVVFAKDFTLPGAGLTPDNPLYFLKTWKEQIQLFFTFNAENKVKQYLHLAGVRLAEYQKMIEKGKTEIAEKTLNKYQEQFNRASDKIQELKNENKEIKDLVQYAEDTIAGHLGVLQENIEKVPEEAKEGIENAIENSQKAIEEVIKKIQPDAERGLIQCLTGTKWCCNSATDCDGLASKGNVYICNEIWNWELIEICDENEICYTGKCRDDCNQCPEYSPPSQDFCKDGEIILWGKDDCGCQLPSTCKRTEPKIIEEHCTSEDCKCGEGYTLTQSPIYSPTVQYYCKINKDWSDFKTCNKESDCEVGYYCLSKYILDKKPSDFRCIPTAHYQMDCGCDIDGSCWCS